MPRWELRQEPHRSYWREREPGRWTWEGRDRKRIVSVTQVLDGDTDRLLEWAVGRAVAAAEAAIGAPEDFGGLLTATGLMPNDYRNAKAAIGTAAHEWLALRLGGYGGAYYERCTSTPLPYGYRAAVDAFLSDERPETAVDMRGPRVERAVGDEVSAVAGTYDAQVRVVGGGELAPGAHRIDLKSSNTLQGKFLSQLAEYERLAVICGEERSDYLTLIHVDGCGQWRPVSIPTGGPEEALALADFDAALARHRARGQLAKLVACNETPEPGDF